MLAYGVVVPVKAGIEVNAVSGVEVDAVSYVHPSIGREKQMTINDPCLPSLSDTAVKAAKAGRLYASRKKVKWYSARVPIKVPVDSESGDIKVEHVLRADKNFLLIAGTAWEIIFSPRSLSPTY
jgi:hypothetical protein